MLLDSDIQEAKASLLPPGLTPIRRIYLLGWREYSDLKPPTLGGVFDPLLSDRRSPVRADRSSIIVANLIWETYDVIGFKLRATSKRTTSKQTVEN